jgi:hypothetical protein
MAPKRTVNKDFYVLDNEETGEVNVYDNLPALEIALEQAYIDNGNRMPEVYVTKYTLNFDTNKGFLLGKEMNVYADFRVKVL